MHLLLLYNVMVRIEQMYLLILYEFFIHSDILHGAFPDPLCGTCRYMLFR